MKFDFRAPIDQPISGESSASLNLVGDLIEQRILTNAHSAHSGARATPHSHSLDSIITSPQ